MEALLCRDFGHAVNLDWQVDWRVEGMYLVGNGIGQGD
jgi:hypothetical protein